MDKRILAILPLVLFFSAGCDSRPAEKLDSAPSYGSVLSGALKQADQIAQENDRRVQAENEAGELAAPREAPTEKQGLAERYYQVVKVVDGDTVDIDIDGKVERLRMIGINTPETVDPRKPVECFGREASAKAKELLAGQEVALEADPTQADRDRYGRLLRYVRTKSGLFYNLEMIRQGYAYEYTYDVPYEYQQDFKIAEAEARTAGRGLWADGACGQKNVRP